MQAVFRPVCCRCETGAPKMEQSSVAVLDSTKGQVSYKTIRKRLSSIRPSPENLILYRPIDPDDPEIVKLAESIKKHGLHEPLTVTADGFVVSGHRRYAALQRNGQVVVPCRVLPCRRSDMSKDDYVALLREHNRQRPKSVAEQAAEEMVDIDPAEAHRKLRKLRDKSVYGYRQSGIDIIKVEGHKRRRTVSSQKAAHVRFIDQVVWDDRREYWPLTVRGVHYALLNYTFYRNIPRKIPYLNDSGSYQATSELTTRLRLSGDLPWEAFDDGTRPITEFWPFSDVRSFVRHEQERLFAGYWRDLLQTQPHHIEVVCEKNTIYHMVLRVTKKYQIPTMSGRGFTSIDPWYDMQQRYLASEKDRLIVIILSDYDPEGESIPHVCGRTLRDDFGIDKLDIIKAGVTRKQIVDYNLPEQNYAKESSSNYDWFLERNDGDTSVYELEALAPADMIRDLETVVTSVLDMDLFNAEAAREQDEAAYLEAVRNKVAVATQGLI